MNYDFAEEQKLAQVARRKIRAEIVAARAARQTQEPVAEAPPEKSWLRQMATAHGIGPSFKPAPEVVIEAFGRKFGEWYAGEFKKIQSRRVK